MRQKTALIFSIGIFVALCIIGAYVLYSDRAGTEQVLMTANWRFLTPALLFTLLSYIFGSLAFERAARIFSAEVPWKDKLRIGFITSAIDNVAGLGGIAGHSVRATLLRLHGIDPSRSVAISFFYSYFNNIVFLSLFPVALLYLIATHNVPQLSAFAIGVIACLFALGLFYSTTLIFSRTIRRASIRWIVNGIKAVFRKDASPALHQFDAAMEHGVGRSRRAAITELVSFSLLDWLAEIAALWFCFMAVGGSLRLSVLVTGFVVSTSLGAASFLPGGFGVQDISMVSSYKAFGVPLQQVILAIIAFRLTYYFLPYVASLYFYLRQIHRKPAG